MGGTWVGHPARGDGLDALAHPQESATAVVVSTPAPRLAPLDEDVLGGPRLAVEGHPRRCPDYFSD